MVDRGRFASTETLGKARSAPIPPPRREAHGNLIAMPLAAPMTMPTPIFQIHDRFLCCIRTAMNAQAR
jgi:hypothetical protein